ncbi:hypothetical protein FRC01_012507 [Tulasnella sp. 417]|nr:hypothetical protein FRC01_012507 [Tulasnella sp. 417]
MVSKLFDVEHQLVFYGAYHSHKVNVAIHMVFVPTILWTAFVMARTLPIPEVFPKIHYTLNQYMTFDFNWPFVVAFLYNTYYMILDPVAGLLYVPEMALSLLTATSFAYRQDGVKNAAILHAVSWIMQFIGHGVAEKRAPALLDNLLGALVLAPFFVHLEILFKLGYAPGLQKNVNNGIGVEIAKFRRAEAEKKRKAA